MMSDQPSGPAPIDPLPVEPVLPEIIVARPIVLDQPTFPSVLDSSLLLSDLPRRSAWADVGLLALGLVISELAITAILQVFLLFFVPPDSAAESSHRALIIPNLALRAIGSVAVVLLLTRRRGMKLASLGVRGREIFLDMGWGLVTLLATYGILLVVMGSIFYFRRDLYEQMGENAEQIMEMIPRLSPWQFLLMSGLIGVYEELVFRGFLMPRLRRALGSWGAAVVCSTLIFTMLHAFDQKPMALVMVAILSLTFSVVTLWRKSILPAVVAHTLFNWSQFVLMSMQAGEQWK